MITTNNKQKFLKHEQKVTAKFEDIFFDFTKNGDYKKISCFTASQGNEKQAIENFYKDNKQLFTMGRWHTLLFILNDDVRVADILPRKRSLATVISSLDKISRVEFQAILIVPN